MKSPCCLCVYMSVYHPYQLLNASTNLMKLGTYITALEPVSTAYFINPSHQSVYLYVYPLSLIGNGSVNTFPRQRMHARIRIFGRVVFCAARVVSKESMSEFKAKLSL
jgi:hypothetical protein